MSKLMVIDPCMDSYRSFIDYEWARETDAYVADTLLSEPFFDLSRSWKEASNTHYMPWLMVQLMKSTTEGLARTHEPVGAQWVEAMAARLPAEMGGSLRHMQMLELRKALQRIEAEVSDALRGKRLEVDPAGVWRSLVSASEFQICLRGSQVLCYRAVYDAYEHFLLRIYKVVTGKTEYRIRPKDFPKDLATALGTGVRDYCWSDSAVNVARVVRHALAHNGTRVTEDVRKLKPELRIEDGEIQIMPGDTKRLYDLLKQRVTRLVTEARLKLAASR